MQNYKRSFRFVCDESQKSLVRAFLNIQGFTWKEEEFAENSCRLLDEPFSLGLSLAAFFGFIYIQDRASMLPPVALSPPKGARVLDMCASPGSKTGQLAAMVGKEGFVLGNEVSPSRIATLRRNLQQMNFLNTATSCYNGQNIPLPSNFFDYIQLDPPCSGWGTVERNPKVMQMWKDTKTLPLIRLQKELLQEAYRLLKPDGVMVYSTCTTNEEENEKQALFAKELGFILEDLPSLHEFVMDEPLCNVKGVWRLSARLGDTQGFFVARFRKEKQLGREDLCYGKNFSHIASPVEDIYAQEQNLIEKKQKKLNLQETQAILKRHEEAETFAKQIDFCETSWGNPLTKRHLQELRINEQNLNGNISIFGESVHFVHKHAAILPEDFNWQGMYMGKVSKHGDIALSPRVRIASTLPHIHFADLKGIEQIKGLLSGQSLSIKDLDSIKSEDYAELLKGEKNAQFSWNGLLLGRLKVKNKRLMWTER